MYNRTLACTAKIKHFFPLQTLWLAEGYSLLNPALCLILTHFTQCKKD